MATSTIIMLVGAGLVGGLAGGMLIGRWWTRRRDEADRGRGEDSVESTSRSQHMEALGVLSGSIMHNLNNLMSVVLGQARLARDEVAHDSAAWHSLGQVIQAGEAAAQLSREVDDYHSEDDHSRRPIRLQPVIRSTVKLLRDILPNTVDIEVTLEDSCGSVLASPTQLQQMIMSLCSNAYHAMFRRRGRVGITLSEAVVDEPKDAVPSVLAPGHYVMISVSDNGRGMDVDTLILTPAHDQFSPPDATEAIVSEWPCTTHETIASADHFLNGRTAAVAERTVEFLTATTRP